MPLLDHSFKKHRVNTLETELSRTGWEAWLILALRRFLSLVKCWHNTSWQMCLMYPAVLCPAHMPLQCSLSKQIAICELFAVNWKSWMDSLLAKEALLTSSSLKSYHHKGVPQSRKLTLSSWCWWGLGIQWEGVFAKNLAVLSSTICMNADGLSNLSALCDKQEQSIYSLSFVARWTSFTGETRSLALSLQPVWVFNR